MTESARTLTFVAVAAVSVAVAWFATPDLNITPRQLANVKLGKPFFDEFNPNDATSIRVVSFDESRAMAKPFAVEFKDGLWTIPSHHGYPADGKDQLAKTAASTIGIKRDEFRSASKEDHEQLGVVDPLEALEGSKLKGRGQRITLNKGDGVLFDLIVGKQLRDRPGYYYVRVPTEDATYVAKIDIQVSTKFENWVETDLLKLNKENLIELGIDNYSISIEGGRGMLVPGEDLRLERSKAAEPWKLAGLDAETEELDNVKINDMVSTLDDLKLVGVRPKPKGLRPDMTIDTEAVQNQLEFQVVVADLSSRGFELVSGGDRSNPQQLKMYSRQGDLNVATNEGVVYTLRFGEIFSGDESEIESGIEDAKSKAQKGEGDDKKAAEKQSSRYLFVTTRFDEKHLGPAPVAPDRPEGLPPDEEKAPEIKAGPGAKPVTLPGSKPSTPSTTKAKPAPKKESKKADDDDNRAADGDDDAKPDEPKKLDDAKADEDKADQPEAPKEKSLAELKRGYDTLRQKYEADQRSYDDKLKAGKEKVDELNRRFGAWYYVISAENFNKLHLSRKDLVKAKDGAAADKPAADEPGTTDADDKKPADNP